MTKFTINSLLLENYRSYGKETQINFGSQITLIFGKGSVGKSTIIDAIQSLHIANENEVDLVEKTYKLLTTKNFSKKKQKSYNYFTLGLSCREENSDDDISIKSIKKDFATGDIPKIGNTDYPAKIALYSNEGSNLDTNPFDEKNKFISTLNLPLVTKEDKNLKNFSFSTIESFRNEYSWKKLHEYTNKKSKELLKYFKKVEDFEKKYDEINKKLNDAEKRNKSNEVSLLQKELDKVFDKEFSAEGFSAVWFPMGTRRGKYQKFVEKGSSLKEFINFIEEDIRLNKVFLYKSNRLYSRSSYEKNFSRKRVDKISLKNKVKFQSQPFYNTTSLAEFLCYTLTEIIHTSSGRMDEQFSLPIIPSRDNFRWGNKIGEEIILSPDKIFELCDKSFKPLLAQIKTVRHQENFNNLIKSLSQFSAANPSASEFNDIVDQNSKSINKWLKEFEYDFKITVDKIGLTGETEINHQKYGYKIPSDFGGSGARYLLTYLTELLDSNNKTLLIEEPEKALHASLQIKLAKLFTEVSKKNQLIIETHSENLLLGILKEIRDKNLNHNKVKVLYVYMENGQSKIDEVQLNEKGGFRSKWRDGFFTEKLDLL